MNFAALSSPNFSDLMILQVYDLFHLKLHLFVYQSVTRVSPSVFQNFLKFVKFSSTCYKADS